MQGGNAYLEKPWLKSYPKEVPADIEIPVESIPQAFDKAVKRWRNRTAIIFYGRRISHLELKDHVDRFATALFDLGVKKGDKVALYLLNSPQYLVAFFGAVKVGAIVTPISPVYVSREVKHQVEDSEAKVLICQDILYEFVDNAGVQIDTVILTNISEYLPRLKRFLGKSVLRSVYKKMELARPEIFRKEGVYQFQDLIKKYPPNPPQIEFNPKEDIVSIPYSGGTTGLPKGILLTHYNLLFNEAAMRYSMPCIEEGKEVLMAFLPFYHIYGVTVFMGGIIRGHVLVIFTAPDLDDIISSMQTYKASLFFSSPGMYEYLKDFKKTKRFNWNRLKILTSSADTLLEDTAREWEKRTGSKIHQAFGMTEAGGGMNMSPYGRPKIGSFGVPLAGTTQAVIDPETLKFVPQGEIGELIVAGPHLMKGYWKKEEETSKTFLEINGKKWLRTGDLVKMDEEGYFYFYDRLRDMIKYKGYSVFAREIEEVLKEHPQIKEAGIIGVPDPKVGQNIKAIIVLEKEARGKISEQEIIDYCKERLAHYKIPKIVEFRGEIPKTDVGKVSRRELREE